MRRGLIIILIIALCTAFGAGFFIINKQTETTRDYGVFLGIGRAEMNRPDAYRTVVIEPAEFYPEDVAKLHEAGKTVYGYLNIGAVEQYRPYFDRFRDINLGVYKDWPDERWIDVSGDVWQNFLVLDLGKRYADMGLDGLFLDNADVYYNYPEEKIFRGLCTILNGLREYDMQLIVNGGDTFVSRCIEEGSAAELFDGINQESVFTCIDFENNSYGEQPEEERIYFQEYLADVKASGLSVYLLEYRADPSLSGRIDAYCKENGFLWYNADGKDLR